ncbi:MAG: GntR family transcriptional regulator [Lachnospiraceae bacterium]
MILNIDFSSEETFYMQLRNQIVFGIAMDQIREGDQLPSVRQLAEEIGINMHTVNKAYALLKQEGFVKVDRRKGAIINVDVDKMRAISDLRNQMQVLLASGICRGISRAEVHKLVDEIYDYYLGESRNSIDSIGEQ